MLQRVIAIKNVGRFKNCVASGDVTFRRYTLIFGENARGKTTFCDILRSLFTNAPAIVVGRKTLGSLSPPEIQLLIGASTSAFRDGTWTATYPDIAVFDGTYIRENVFAGDAVDTEHRRNLYRVIIGAQGVTLAATLDEFDGRIKAKTSEIRDNRSQMQPYIPQGMTVENFIELAEDQVIDEKVSSKEQELLAIRQAAQLQQKAGLATLTIPVFPVAFATLLAKTFANVAANAESSVTEHIARHAMKARGEPWITAGLQFIVDDTCPFCNQSLSAIELINHYRSYFSREYHALREEVAGLKRQVEATIGESAAVALQHVVEQNGNISESWRQYCEVANPVLRNAATITPVMSALRESAQALLETKAGTPLEAVSPDDRFTESLAAFEELRANLGAYNAEVAAANAIISERKRAAQTANLLEAERALGNLKAQKVRHTQMVRTLCEVDAKLQNEKTELENEKATARQQLDTHTQQVITQYGQRINWYLERINASFAITTPTHTYRGGPPSTSYQIVINQNAVDLGDPATPADTPSFKNTLSAGDRSTLALAFFFAQLEQDINKTNKIVVFDDPFASMDGFRRSHTVNQIFRCGMSCAQIVVLSHDPGFLHLLWERIAAADRKTLTFARITEENTTIAEWDIEQAVQHRFRADLDMLSRFFTDGEGEPRNVIQKIRPVLEAYSRNVLPTHFEAQEMLGGIITKINDVREAHPLFPIVEDLEELNVYTRRYHHGENPSSAATEPVDHTELQGYVRRTLKIVGCLT